MIKTVYTAIDGVCDAVGEATGIKLTAPRPSKRALQTSVITNGVVGASLILLGVVTPYKWPIVLGGVSLAASVWMREEARKL